MPYWRVTGRVMQSVAEDYYVEAETAEDAKKAVEDGDIIYEEEVENSLEGEEGFRFVGEPVECTKPVLDDADDLVRGGKPLKK